MTTWTLSGFGDEIDPDPDVQLGVLGALGARCIEVRSAWGTNAVDLDGEQLEALAARVTARGMRVSAIASPVGKARISAPEDQEVERLRRVIGVAHRLDARYVRVFSFWPAGHGEGDHPLAAGALPDEVAAGMRDDVRRRMRGMADLAEQEDVVLVLENEKDVYGDVPERVLDVVEAVGSAHLQVAWDSANYVQCGVRPFDRAYPLLRDHLAYLQVKDARTADAAVVPAGEGDGQVAETLAALRDDGYEGFASLEPHLALGSALGGFSGPFEFGRAARAFRALTREAGVELA